MYLRSRWMYTSKASCAALVAGVHQRVQLAEVVVAAQAQHPGLPVEHGLDLVDDHPARRAQVA